MLTLFTIPKPFRGHIATIQRNAIQSWLQLQPACQIILFGDDAGVAEAAAEFNVTHVPDVQRNEHGTPLLNSVFETAQRLSTRPWVCYVNADIILLSDFVEAVQRIPKRSFLMVGRRRCLEIDRRLNFDPAWESDLRTDLVARGVLDRHDAIDYFVFPRGLCKDMPPFAVGRAGWDNWFIYWARSVGVPVIDATQAVTAIHQNHDYAHHPKGKDGVYRGEEAKQNIELAGGLSHAFDSRDATWLLGPMGLRPALSLVHLQRRKQTLPILFPNSGLRVGFLRLALSIGIEFRSLIPGLHPRRVGRRAQRPVVVPGLVWE